MMTWEMHLGVAVALLALGSACGDEDGSRGAGGDTLLVAGDVAANATSPSDAETREVEVTGGGTDAVADGDGPETASQTDTATVPGCDHSGLVVASESFAPNTTDSSYTASSAHHGEFFSVLFYSTYDDSGAPKPPVAIGDYPIGANELDRNFGTCTTCIYAGRECDAENWYSCKHSYFGTMGTIHVTEFDDATATFVGWLEDVKLEEVTFGDDRITSIPVADGETWCFEHQAMSAKTECSTDGDCTDPNKPRCSNRQCVECLSDFDCAEAARPMCIGATCGSASAPECSGDDEKEPNDFPSSATPLVLGTTVEAEICQSASGTERDYYKVTTSQRGRLYATVSWADDVGLSVSLHGVGQPDAAEVQVPGVDRASAAKGDAPIGDYVIAVEEFDPGSTAPGTTVPYTLTVTLAPTECTTDIDCEDPSRSHCATDHLAPDFGLCTACQSPLDCGVATPACVLDPADGTRGCQTVDACSGDDNHEPQDDGPAGATPIAIGDVVSDHRVCGGGLGASAAEEDWFVATLGAHAGASAQLEWAGDGQLGLYVYDASLSLVDMVDWGEAYLDLSTVAAGKYYLSVRTVVGDPVDAAGYTLSLRGAP